MKLQEQCCTREQGERLVQLGMKPEATFWWMPSMSGPHGEYIQYGWHGNAIAPAYNVAELGQMLPKHPGIAKTETAYNWYHRYHWQGHTVGYSESGGHNHIGVLYFDTEAKARAALLILLLENNLITADQVNESCKQ
jgi:hypothetical protein